MTERFKLYAGDCLDLMRQLPDASVDLILCDLPYGTTQNKWDAVIPFAEIWAQYNRITKPNAAVVLTAAQPFTSALVMSNPGAFKYQWVWEKEPSGNLNAKRRPMVAHEDVLVFSNGAPEYRPQGLRPTLRKRGPRDNSKTENYGAQRAVAYEQTVTGYPASILSIAKDRNGEHPTQKPVALMEYLIRTYTNEGMTVLDNCMGSGTTGVACMNTGRNFIGMEKDRDSAGNPLGYCKIAHRRISQALETEPVTVYLTPYDPQTFKTTGPSTDSGFESVDQAVECLGSDWATCSDRAAFYPVQGLAVTDYVLQLDHSVKQ